VASIRYPDDIAIIDEPGSLSFAEVQRRTNALAHAWSDEGPGRGGLGGDFVPQPPRLCRCVVFLSELPRTATGKVIKRELTAR